MQFTAWSLHFSPVRRHSSWSSVSIVLQDAVHLGFLSRFSFLGCSKRSDRRQQVCFACSYWSKFLIGPARFRPLVSRFSTAETFDPLWSADSDLSCFLPLVLFPSRSCPWLWFSWSCRQVQCRTRAEIATLRGCSVRRMGAGLFPKIVVTWSSFDF
jgi:hypothetical protein